MLPLLLLRVMRRHIMVMQSSRDVLPTMMMTKGERKEKCRQREEEIKRRSRAMFSSTVMMSAMVMIGARREAAS